MDRDKKNQDDIVINTARMAEPANAARIAQSAASADNHKKDNKSEASLINFKRVVRGYSPDDVNDYISVQNANLENAQRVFDAQSAELKNNLAFVSRERDKLKEEQKNMAEKVESYEQKNAELKVTAEELEALKAQNAQLQEQVKSLFTKLGSCKNLVSENQQYKRIIGEFDNERNRAKNEMAKLNAEIAELREINTKQAYAYAEQKKDIEMQFTNEKLRNAELLQVHTYHIQKTEELLNEMYKQFSLAKKSLNEMTIKK